MINRSKLLKSLPPLSPLSAQSAALGEIPAASTPQALNATEPAAPPKAKRPAILVGVASPNVWLREQVKEILATEVSEKTRAQYERNGARLDAQRVEGELAATLQKNLARIAHVQLADNPGRNEPGTGEINYPFLFAHLDRIGYGGWVGCEYKPAQGTEAGLVWLEKLVQKKALAPA